MKANMGCMLLAMMSIAARADVFPYGTDMADRFCSSVPIEVTETETVPQASAMPATDSVVTSTFDVKITAVAPEDWNEDIERIADEGVPQSGLVVREDADGNFSWWGFSGGAWIELTGADAAEGKWTY